MQFYLGIGPTRVGEFVSKAAEMRRAYAESVRDQELLGSQPAIPKVSVYDDNNNTN